MTLSDDAQIAPHPDVVFREVDGEVVLLNTSTGQYYSLDAVGSRVWSLLATGVSRKTLQETLLAEFDVVETQLQADVDALVEQLAAHALIVVT
jgi:hypothetical protein